MGGEEHESIQDKYLSLNKLALLIIIIVSEGILFFVLFGIPILNQRLLT